MACVWGRGYPRDRQQMGRGQEGGLKFCLVKLMMNYLSFSLINIFSPIYMIKHVADAFIWGWWNMMDM